ncbi:permease [Heliorestis convoluta]|uniref:Putative permease family protein n=1 Tax=Heliorestis convoluta TaxID=356322 RepID=A0A5Q2N763_9FIRM|nr:permease [Heliorestis convoluta]QGG49396.1 putative permease family protein [Heliorestis convoluta]
MKERNKFLLMLLIFLAAFYIPLDSARVQGALIEAFYMLQDYAREHVLTCLIPAFFIAGAIAIFVSQAAVLKYFGAAANKVLSYAVASVSGTILAVCSCTVLPLFAGIYMRGAGIGPATAFLFSGPAINVLAIILTAKVLGWELGVARAIGAIVFSIVIGLLMHLIFLKEEKEKEVASFHIPAEEDRRSLWQYIVYFGTMILLLITASWGRPPEDGGFFYFVYTIKWPLTVSLLILLAILLKRWFTQEERKEWVGSTWSFTKQIFPLLLIGVLVAGFLMGRPGTDSGIIPAEYVSALVGGNSLSANFLAAFLGAFMYFATLTEVPILQGLLGSGMGKGPALALLLAGPSLSLPNVIVIHQIMGFKKTAVYVVLVVTMATISGFIFGTFWG